MKKIKKKQKEYISKARKLLETKLYGIKLIKMTNIRAVPVQDTQDNSGIGRGRIFNKWISEQQN